MEISKHIDRFDPYIVKTYVKRVNKLVGWKKQKSEGTESIAKRLDDFANSKGLLYPTFLPIRQLIIFYNDQNNLLEFEGEEMRSMVGGFGTLNGGVPIKFKKIEDKLYTQQLNTFTNEFYSEWQECEYEFFVTHFCTIEQWNLIHVLEI